MLKLPLTTLSWDANWDIEESLISKLETRWPDLHLNITNNRRHQPASAKSIDTRLLSSPLLHSLEYNIFYFRKGNGIVSDFAYLMGIISRSTRLRKLRIGIYSKEQTLNPDLEQFSLLPDEILPAVKELVSLKSLKLSERILGNVTPDYCEELQIVSSAIWNGCGDIPKTTELELLGLSPRYVFENIRGKAPNLKGIDFPIKTVTDYGGNPLPKSTGDIDAVWNTLYSFSGVEEMQLSNHDENFDRIWPTVPTLFPILKLLRMKSTNPRYEGLSQHTPRCYLGDYAFESMAGSSITHLEIDVALEAAKRTWHACFPRTDANYHLWTLSQLHNLTTLRLCIAVDESSPRFALLAKSMAPNIFKAFYRNSSLARLKYLSIYFVNGLATNVVSEMRWERSYILDSDGKYVAALTQKRPIRPSVVSSLARYEKRKEGKDVVSRLVNPDSTWGLLDPERTDGEPGEETTVLDLAGLSIGEDARRFWGR